MTGVIGFRRGLASRLKDRIRKIAFLRRPCGLPLCLKRIIVIISLHELIIKAEIITNLRKAGLNFKLAVCSCGLQ